MSHPDFSEVETPWNKMHLHESNIVWYAYYPKYESTNTEIKDGRLVTETKKGRWVAYYTTRDYVGKKPWCNPNWSIMNFDLLTEEEAIKACLYHLEYINND